MDSTMEHDARTCSACQAIAAGDNPYLVWQDDLWYLRHARPPFPTLGWMTLHSKRHVAGLPSLSVEELADLGPVLSRVSNAIMAGTGALRVYLASFTETAPHFHVQLVPRYAGGPKGWEAFKLKETAASAGITSDQVREVMLRTAGRL